MEEIEELIVKGFNCEQFTGSDKRLKDCSIFTLLLF